MTQWCYAKVGLKLPRVAQDQYDVMTHIDLKDAKPGDLIFFHSTYDAGTYVTHVGIYAGENRMFHAEIQWVGRILQKAIGSSI